MTGTGPPSSPQRFQLSGTCGQRPVRYRFGTGSVRIGSAADSDLRLPEPTVSRRHAVVRASEAGVSIEDVGSRNGVRLDGVGVTRAVISPGSRVEFGAVSLIFELLDEESQNLALRLDVEAESSTPSLDSASTRSLLKQSVAPWVLEVLDAAVGQPDHQLAMLRAIRSSTQCRGAALFALRDDLVIESAVGSTEGLRPLPALLAKTETPNTTRRTWADLDLDVALIAGAEKTRGLVLHGAKQSLGTSELLLLAGWACAPRTFERGPDSPAPSRQLEFPADHLPSTSPVMLAVYDQLLHLAPTDLPVLISGESGVGKEGIAQILHLSSDRRDGPFVAINCAAMPEDLVEAELFGVAPGAATGTKERRGRFQEADGGVIFLDEIGELPARLQAKLLRVLQDKRVAPLGGPAQRLDFRVISATNRNLQDSLENGELRNDLYYRLAGAVLELPPLRTRPDDIPDLIRHFLERTARSGGFAIDGVTTAALDALVRHDWPGNVRELQNVVEGLAWIARDTGIVRRDMITLPSALDTNRPETSRHLEDLDLRRHIDRLEEGLVAEAMRRSDGVQTEAARLLGISRNGLANKLRRFGTDS